MDRVAEAEQIFGQISTVLPGDTGKERNAPFRILNRHFVKSIPQPSLAFSFGFAEPETESRDFP
jgi:hypothetical protein